MGTQTVSIQITAKDGASAVFTKVASTAKSAFAGLATGAKSAGTGLREIGSAGTAAGSGLGKLNAESSKAAGNLNKTASSAKSAATGVSDLGTKATATGAALGSMVAGLGKLGNAAVSQQTSIDGLTRAYGDAVDEILRFTDAIQASTKFSNEDAREAARIAATLAQNYGFTTGEIEKLISASADLATVAGVSLSDAVQRTSSAMRGEAESAEYLGLTLNQQAIDRAGITLSMSNEEAAHFRLNALLQQAAYAEGAAGDAAQTTAGQAAQAANAWQDMTVSLGSALGPIGGMASGLSDMSIALTLGGAALGNAVGKLSDWNVGAKTSAGASKLLAAALTPVGAALGAATLVVGAAVFAWADLQAQNEKLATSFDKLGESIKQLDTAEARENVRGLADEIGQLEHMPIASDNGPLQNIINGLTTSSADLKSAFIDATAGMIDTAEQVGISTGDIEHSIENMVDAVTSGAIVLEDGTKAFDAFNDVMAATGPNIELVQSYAQGLFDKFADGTITAEEFAASMKGITDVGIGDWADNAAQMLQMQFDQMEAQTQGFHKLSEAQKAYLEGEANRVVVGQAGIAQMQHEKAVREGLEAGIYDQWQAMNVQADAYNTQIAAAKEYEAEQERIREAQAAVASELRGQLVPALEGASHGFDAMVQPGEDVLDTLARIAPASQIAGGAFLQFVDNLNDAKQALDGVLGMYAQIDALGTSASGAADIATKLVGEPGTWATLDDLLASAAISQEQYNGALAAGYDIQEKNVGIQEDLNAIRANQLPLLDSQVTKLAAYVDGLTDASAAEQQQALYLMDSANQAKVAAAYSTAYAASLGEIPPDVATQIVADAAQADPILADILESFGLIEVGADGVITLNFPDKTVLDDTTTAINNLNNSQIEIFLAMIDGKATEEEIAAVEEHLVNVDGKRVTASVAVEVDDSGLTSLDTALASGAGFGAGAGITVDVNANTEPLMAGIADIPTPAPIEVPIKLGAVQTNMPTGDELASKFDTSAQDKTVTVTVEAVDNASSTIARVMQAATALQTVSGDVDLKATDNASSVIARVMQAANALQSTSGSIELNAEDNTGSVIAQAMQAANAFSDASYDASLTATDSSGSVVAQAMQAANAYATGEYNASLVASDNASGPVIQPAIDLANSFANGEYNASLVATDSASSIIQGAIDLATSFASEYAATLTAVDNATGVINSVSAALDALDGKTAVTYVTTQEVSSLPAKALGGAVMPTARLGRNVLVGEAGPEVVTMPFGAFVKPHGAEGSADTTATTDDGASEKRDRERAQSAERAQRDYERRLKEMQEAYDKFLAHAEKTGGSLLPHVDTQKAYMMGGESAKAFYDGLLDAARSRMDEQASAINSTRFASKDDAKEAIAEYNKDFAEWRKLQDKKSQGAEYDRRREHAANQAARAEERRGLTDTADEAVDTMATAGTEAGEEFSSNLSESMDVGSVLDQVMKLKDEFVDSMKTSAGATEDVTGAVSSFNDEIANIVGGLKQAGRSGDKALGSVSDSFGDVEEDAEDMGKTVGEELGDGVTTGAEDAEDALGRVAAMMGAVSSQAVDPSVGIDSKSASSGINDISGQLKDLNATEANPGVDVQVDDSEWESFKRDVDSAQLGVTVTVKTKEKDPSKKKQLGGAITPSIERDVPRAANGRVITVGEAGEENVYLPYGAMVMPHDASNSRGRADAQTSGNIQFFGPVTIVPPTPDIHAAVVSQFMSMDRD